MEVHRFNGKYNIDEYLIQFELASRYNKWSDNEHATALLCALDGPRGTLADFDDLQAVTKLSVDCRKDSTLRISLKCTNRQLRSYDYPETKASASSPKKSLG
jgi:hypothetical protein